MKQKTTFPTLFIVLILFTLNACKKNEKTPVKQSIEGEIRRLQFNIHSGSVDFLSFELVEDSDRKTYNIGMDEVSASGFFDFNGSGYIDSTNLILKETNIVEQTGYLAVTPIQSKNNHIYIEYDDEGDKILKTKRIVGRISEKTILVVGDNDGPTKNYKSPGGITKYLAPNLLSCLNRGFAGDVNPSQPGEQHAKLYIYNIRQID